jgi:hypothetical protein
MRLTCEGNGWRNYRYAAWFTTSPKSRIPAAATSAQPAQGNGGNSVLIRNKMITERDERRTAEWLRKEAATRGLKAGRKVRIEQFEKYENGKTRRYFRSGRVTELHPYIFVCEVGRGRECFRYNEFLGNETGRRVLLNE